MGTIGVGEKACCPASGHVEQSETSPFRNDLRESEILRFAQNDKRKGVFHQLHNNGIARAPGKPDSSFCKASVEAEPRLTVWRRRVRPVRLECSG